MNDSIQSKSFARITLANYKKIQRFDLNTAEDNIFAQENNMRNMISNLKVKH